MSNEARRKTKRRATGGEPDAKRSLISGFIVTAAASAVLILLFSIIVYSTPDPGKLVLPAALAAAYIASYAGGFTSAWKNRGEPLPCGLLTGGAFFVLLILLSLIIPEGTPSKISFWPSVGLHSLLIVFSLLGALSATSLRESSRHKRPRRR